MATSIIQQMPLDCYTDDQQKIISFAVCGKVSVIQGADILEKIDLSKIAIPLDDYTRSSLSISPGTAILNGVEDMKFMMILITYPDDESLSMDDRYIEWSMDNVTWHILREMLIVTGENNFVYVRNERTFTVRMDILAAQKNV